MDCKKTYSTGYSQAVTHSSTNPAQCCLTSVIRREPVLSAWYGRRTLEHIHTGHLYRTKHCEFLRKTATKGRMQMGFRTEIGIEYKKKETSWSIVDCKKTYSTGYSQAVTHPSTNPAQCCLTSVIRREPVHSAWNGRRTLEHLHTGYLYKTKHRVFLRKTATKERMQMGFRTEIGIE